MIGLGILVAAVLMAIAAPLLADEAGLRDQHDAQPDLRQSVGVRPARHGQPGRDVLAQFVWGARTSLLVGLAATILAILIGSIVGITLNFYGGKLGNFLMRITEWFLVVHFFIAIVLAAILGPSVKNIILVIGITSWPSTARLIRAQVLTLKRARLRRSQPCARRLEPGT